MTQNTRRHRGDEMAAVSHRVKGAENAEHTDGTPPSSSALGMLVEVLRHEDSLINMEIKGAAVCASWHSPLGIMSQVGDPDEFQILASAQPWPEWCFHLGSNQER